jgi:Phospholipase_D-nuclease N-terminal
MVNSLLLAQQSSGGGGGLLLGGGFLVIIFLIVIAASIFWIWMLIDCLVSNKPAVEKIIWLLVIFFLHLLGALIYFFIGRSGRSAVA